MRQRSRPLIHVFDLLLLLVAVVAFYPQVGRPGAMSPGGDMVNLFLPAREWAAQWLSRGIIPLWNPQVFGGVPFLGAMQAGVFYPPNLVAGLFLPPLAAINLLRLAHIYLFGVLTWLFLRIERGCGRPAALLGAVAVAGSALVASHTDHINQLAAIAWLPALAACTWRFGRTGRRAALLLFVIVLAVQILAGHPQAVFYSVLLCGATAGAWAVQFRVSSFEFRVSGFRRGAWFALFVVAVAGGFLLAAIQLVPTAETSRFSRRSHDGLDYALWGSMQPRFLLTAVSPRAFGDPESGYDPLFGSECSPFVGRATLLLAVMAVTVGVGRRRPYALFWAAIVIVSCILALGGYGPFSDEGPRPSPIFGPFPPEGRPSPIFRAYLALLPPARHLRVPPRILLLAVFGLAVLGAEGLDWLCRRGNGTRRKLLFGALAWIIVALVATELWLFQRREFHHRVVTHHPPEVYLGGGASDALGPLLRFADLAQSPLADFRVFRLMVHDPDYLMDARPAAVRNRYRRLQPNLGMPMGMAEVEGYEEGLLPPVRYYDFLNFFHRNLRNPDPDAVLLGLMNVRYVYADYNLAVRSAAWRPVGEVIEPATGQGETDRRYRLYENPLWLPRVVWEDWLPSEINLHALRGPLSRGAQQPGPRMSVAQSCGRDVEAIARGGRLVEPDRLSSLQVRVVDPHRIVVGNPARRGGTLLVAQNAFPGWVVEAAGEVTPLRPRTDFSGSAVVPPGAEQIDIVYRPFSFRLGAYLSVLTLATWVCAVVFFIGKRADGNVNRER